MFNYNLLSQITSTSNSYYFVQYAIRVQFSMCSCSPGIQIHLSHDQIEHLLKMNDRINISFFPFIFYLTFCRISIGTHIEPTLYYPFVFLGGRGIFPDFSSQILALANSYIPDSTTLSHTVTATNQGLMKTSTCFLQGM